MFYGIATHDVSFIFAHFPYRNDVIGRKLTSNFPDNRFDLSILICSLLSRHSLDSSHNLHPPQMSAEAKGEEDCKTSPKNACVGDY